MKFKISTDTPAQSLGYMSIPLELRGEIKGEAEFKEHLKKIKFNRGRKPTNKEFAEQNGISKREASRRRRGY